MKNNEIKKEYIYIEDYKDELKILRRKYNKQFYGLLIFYILYLPYIAYIVYTVLQGIFNNLFMFSLLGIIMVCQLVYIDGTHELFHKRELERYNVKCKDFDKCTVVLNNHIFSKDDYIRGLKAPYDNSAKNILFSNIFILLIYLIISVGCMHNYLYLLISIILIVLNIMITNVYSKRVSIRDILYEDLLNNPKKHFECINEIKGVEMILKYENYDKKEYVPLTDENVEKVCGAKGIVIYYI